MTSLKILGQSNKFFLSFSFGRFIKSNMALFKLFLILGFSKCVHFVSRAAGFCFIFASLLMLLTTICFIIGAPVQAVCSSVLSGELYEKVFEINS